MTLLCCVHLQGQIQELTVENNALIEKLTAEENKRKELSKKSQVLLAVHLLQQSSALETSLDSSVVYP